MYTDLLLCVSHRVKHQSYNHAPDTDMGLKEDLKNWVVTCPLNKKSKINPNGWKHQGCFLTNSKMNSKTLYEKSHPNEMLEIRLTMINSRNR